jgi:hypothetical protein
MNTTDIHPIYVETSVFFWQCNSIALAADII